jgi:hypothetical protein
MPIHAEDRPLPQSPPPTRRTDALGRALAARVVLLALAACRWPRFADARHTVRLYHGDRTT